MNPSSATQTGRSNLIGPAVRGSRFPAPRQVAPGWRRAPRDGRRGEPCQTVVARVILLALLEEAARALLAALIFSKGVPMFAGGDELWRTQGGNYNAYRQMGLLPGSTGPAPTRA